MGMELPEPTVVLLYVAWRTLVQNLTSLNWEPITPHIDKFYVTVKSDTPSVYLHKTNIDGIIFICHVRFINENNNVDDFETLQFAIDAFYSKKDVVFHLFVLSLPLSLSLSLKKLLNGE